MKTFPTTINGYPVTFTVTGYGDIEGPIRAALNRVEDCRPGLTYSAKQDGDVIVSVVAECRCLDLFGIVPDLVRFFVKHKALYRNSRKSA